jgi:predicted transcriptional regulator
VLRRFDPDRRVLTLSELLPTRSRNFELAATIGLLTQTRAIDELLADAALTTDASRTLARVALANAFAGAVLMPYEPFLAAARQARYDIDIIARRFRVSFEQAAHRLTALRRPGAEGIRFHFVRMDAAGNISKRFSASGIRFARFSGTCPRWNVFAAFQTPGLIRVQISQMPEGDAYFCIARTIQKESFGWHAQPPLLAIGLGCSIEEAHGLVYADGIDLRNERNVVPVGVTCRTCTRTDCTQRAVPSLRGPIRIDEHVRRVSPYTA